MGRNRRREDWVLAAADRLNSGGPAASVERWPLLVALIRDASS